MPMPKWLAKFNRKFLNKRQVKKGKRPVLTHTGRTSGTTYKTPLDAFPIDGGYLFMLIYGPDSDWAQNILAAGRATVTVAGRGTELINPRVVPKDEVWHLVPEGTRPPPRFQQGQLLRMDTAG